MLKLNYAVTVVMALLSLASVNALSHAASAATPADTVFTGGKVYTINNAQPWAEAVAIEDGKIIYVGDAAGAKAFIGDGTKVIDTKGKTVMPGFVSAHDHLIASAWTNAGVQIYDAKDKADALAKIKAYADANPDHKVIKGIGWDKNMLGGLPIATDLDAVISDRPAIILDNTIHDAWLNTAAMKAANITKDTEDTVPGVPIGSVIKMVIQLVPQSRSSGFKLMPTWAPGMQKR